MILHYLGEKTGLDHGHLAIMLSQMRSLAHSQKTLLQSGQVFGETDHVTISIDSDFTKATSFQSSLQTFNYLLEAFRSKRGIEVLSPFHVTQSFAVGQPIHIEMSYHTFSSFLNGYLVCGLPRAILTIRLFDSNDLKKSSVVKHTVVIPQVTCLACTVTR